MIPGPGTPWISSHEFILSSQRGSSCQELEGWLQHKGLGTGFLCAATAIPAHRQPGKHVWEAGARFGGSWGAEEALSHSEGEDFTGAQSMARAAGSSGLALTSWPIFPTSTGSSLPAFAEVVDQDEHAQGDEEVGSDDPCHHQGIQLLTVGTNCRGTRAREMLRARNGPGLAQVRAPGRWEGEKGKLGGKGGFRLPKMSSRTPLLPTQSGNGLGSTTFTHPSTENQMSAPKICLWEVQGEGSALTSGIQVQLALLFTRGAGQVGRSAVMVLYNEFPVLGVPCSARRVPPDLLVLKGTRDCHRGARNLHQEFPLEKYTSEEGNQGEN